LLESSDESFAVVRASIPPLKTVIVVLLVLVLGLYLPKNEDEDENEDETFSSSMLPSSSMKDFML
jgi:hypothetical protein